MEALAKAMGGEGKYIVYVGSLTVPLHNKWADAAIALPEGEVSRRCSSSPTASASPRAWTTATRPRSTRCAPTRPQGHPRLRQPGSDRRRPRRRGARQGQDDRRRRAVLARPGREVHQVRRHPRGLHLEPDARRRGDRPHRRHAGQGQGADRTGWRCPGSARCKVDEETHLILAQKLAAHQQGHDRRAWSSMGL